MAELYKVIKGLECCIDEKHGCYNCEFKYTDGRVACKMFEQSYNSIPTELLKDALELLKEQAERLDKYREALLDKQDVVRCKNCKYGQLMNGEIWCHKYTPRTMIPPDWFCADGELKE